MATVMDQLDPMKSGGISEGKQETASSGGQQASSEQWNGSAAANTAPFPPPKTDKPRPHVCTTCGRSFARLEHLKRHERSHTKEKPFECPECTRCFARRDLLLRHQQKLHATTTPSARPRHARRESTSSNAASKVRKPPQGANGSGSMRPRANTISHIDGNALGIIAATNSTMQRRNPVMGHIRHPSLGHLDMKPMGSPGNRRGPPNGMLKLNTHALNMDVGGSLRTAPAFGGFPPEMGMDDFMFSGNNTVNPAQLHFADSPQSMAFDSPGSPFRPGFTFGQFPVEEDPNFDWINGFENQMSFSNPNEHAVTGSSPSAISTGSSGHMDSIAENQVHLTQEQWQNSLMNESSMMPTYDANWAITEDFTNDPVSPGMDLSGQDPKFSPPFDMSSSTGPQNGLLHPLMAFGSPINSPNTAPSVSSGSNRHSSVTSVGTDTITEATRQSLLSVLSQFSGSASRKYSQPSVSSPLSPGFSRPRSAIGSNLPSTADLQRYVAAYVQYFHPRLPFLHIPTLSFDTQGSGAHGRTPGTKSSFTFSGSTGDGGPLLLSMAAIGALFEYEHAVSKELFDMAKKLIQLYLEERRRADMCAAIGVATNNMEASAPSTPLWLVQSMLLNVIYGNNCGDRAPADMASTRCHALVSLARAAGLAKGESSFSEDLQMANDPWVHSNVDEAVWISWKLKEERKRTLYAIFVVSSMLVSLYNFPPCLTNSEIGLELPCDESLWAAETASAFHTLGGSAVANQSITFAKALSSLLTASQRHPFQPHQIQSYNRPTDARLSSPELPPAAFYSSSFGCLVLIDALHNYIWETRQRHLGRQWTIQETEAMQAHIGPALLAYQAVWRESSHHSIQRPNPHLANDLAADCIPFLDLAFVRLFVSLGRSKECFWHRDWDGMSHEIACGCEILSHAENPATAPSDGSAPAEAAAAAALTDAASTGSAAPGEPELAGAFSSDQSTKRERHLRKAAGHAAHSLHVADVHGVSLADYATREVNMGSAICAMDCVEILAEWVAMVQERVGRYIGVLGKDDADFETVPGMLLLEEEDISLLRQIKEIVRSSESKLDSFQMSTATATGNDDAASSTEKNHGGLSSRLLKVMARMCDCAATWSVMHLIARNLESQADYMQARAERSLVRAE